MFLSLLITREGGACVGKCMATREKNELINNVTQMQIIVSKTMISPTCPLLPKIINLMKLKNSFNCHSGKIDIHVEINVLGFSEAYFQL